MSRSTQQFERERAKRLCAACMSSRLGTSFATEYKLIGDGEICRFWYQLAEEIDYYITERMGEHLLGRPEKSVIH